MSSASARAAPATAWPGRTHWAAQMPVDAACVTLLGRLVDWGGGAGTLVDQSGAAPVVSGAASTAAAATSGDIVAVSGPVRGRVLKVIQLTVLVPGRGALAPGSDWRRFAEQGGLRARNLRVRAQVLAAIRAFFAHRGFLEVETPVFVTGTGQEAHVDFFTTEFRAPRRRVPGVLIPSPEHHMKRLLGGGFERIYQIAKCFRNGELSPRHNPEFTMLEWYRAYATYEEVMCDVEDLVRAVVSQVRGAPVAMLGQRGIDLEGAWPRVTVASAFQQYAGVDLRACREARVLRQAAAASGCSSVTERDSFEDAFHKLLIERVEPALEAVGACFLQDYPVALGALARRKPADPDWAERAEAYVGGMELANGFSELNDAAEQRQRFQNEAGKRQAAGMAPLNTDHDFLRMLACGMPPAAGMALGVDRLVLLCAGGDSLDEVIAFPISPPAKG